MPEDARSRLRDHLDGALTNMMAVLPGADNEPGWDLPTSEEGWNVRLTLAHLVVAEKSMHLLIARALAAGEQGAAVATLEAKGPDGQPFDLDRWNIRQVEKRQGQPASALRNELAEVRTDTLRNLAALREEQLETPAWHPALGFTTVGGIYRIIGIHMKDHTRAMKLALKAAMHDGRYWGNA